MYQLLLSPGTGINCPMYPNCSLYAYQAFKKYNPLKAYMMTLDRLYRCGRDINNYDTVEFFGSTRLLDPVLPNLGPIGSNHYTYTWYEAYTQSPENNPQKMDSLLVRSFSYSIKDVDRLYNFAETLKHEEKYDHAIVEYRRLLSYFPNSRYQKDALISIVFCYYKSNQYLESIEFGQKLLYEGDINSEDENELKFLIGACYFKFGNFPLARAYFMQLEDSANELIKEKGTLLQGLSYVQETDWQNAEKCFASIPLESKFSYNARICEKLSREGRMLGRKSPIVAGILGIVPGLGYLYDEYEQTALSSFVVNSLFIWGTFEALRKDNKSIGAILGFFSLGWYTGNIYGSIISAQRGNIKANNDLIIKFDIGFEF
jgi:tetratricopeptide (TPR) repeat protein